MGMAGMASNRIWKHGDVRIEPSGDFVKLIAPCGESRRVSPETARKIAADLMVGAELVEEWQAAMGQAREMAAAHRGDGEPGR